MRRRLGELERNEKKRRAEHAKRKEWNVKPIVETKQETDTVPRP